MKDILTIFDKCRSIEDMDNAVRGVIAGRSSNGKKLAKKFKELKGLAWNKFMEKLPMELDFITAHEMFQELNKKTKRKFNVLGKERN
jgi:hypothetical protein